MLVRLPGKSNPKYKVAGRLFHIATPLTGYRHKTEPLAFPVGAPLLCASVPPYTIHCLRAITYHHLNPLHSLPFVTKNLQLSNNTLRN